jgi:hypothetical protein
MANDTNRCPVFGVRSGGPVIGLGILVIIFGIVPVAIGNRPIPASIDILFIGFGGFLIWIGLKR